MKKAPYGKPAVNDRILKIVLRHLTRPAAEELFEELSKVGGGRIKGAAKRILWVVHNAEVKSKRP
jgi:hypothetical protein